MVLLAIVQHHLGTATDIGCIRDHLLPIQAKAFCPIRLMMPLINSGTTTPIAAIPIRVGLASCLRALRKWALVYSTINAVTNASTNATRLTLTSLSLPLRH